MKIYQLYQDVRAQHDNTIMVALENESHLIVEAYDEHHLRMDTSVDIRMLRGWYVDVWENGKIIDQLLVDELRVPDASNDVQ